MKMNKKIPGIVLVAALPVVSSAYAIDMTVSTYHPASHYFTEIGVESWMSCVEDRSDIEFQFFPGGQIASGENSLDAVNNGLTDVVTIPIGYVSGKMPLSGLSMLPNMGGSADKASRAFREMVESDTYIAEEFAENNITPIMVSLLPPYQIQTKGEPLDSLDKFDGAIIRSGGGSMTLVIESLGASPIELTGADMYTSMQRGIIEGTIMPISSIKPYSMHELVDSVSTNADFGTFSNIFVMNSEKYNSLSDGHREAINECGIQAEKSLSKYLDSADEELIKEYEAMGINIYEIPEQELEKINQKFEVVANDFVARLESRGEPAEEVLEDYRKVLEEL